jgi:DNA repair protein RecO (recombination protein O)
MAKSFQTPAFVLRTVDYGDADVIVTMLGREIGKFSAMARSAKRSTKRFGGSLLPMRALDATVSFKPQRSLANLLDASVVRDFPGLEATFEKITFASYATELVRAVLREGDKASEVFDLLDAYYTRLGGAADDDRVLEVMLHHFTLDLLSWSGAAPELDGCHRCGVAAESLDKLRCLRTGEGLVCNDCARRGEAYGVIDTATLSVLRYLRSPEGTAPREVAESATLAQARRIIEAALHTVVDTELKSRGMLEPLLSSMEAR